MGLMSKFKNMFTEEIEDEPIRKEVIQVEIPAPAKVEKVEKPEIIREEIVIKKEEPKIELDTPKKEDKFTFPVFFDDKDFDVIEKPKKEAKVERKVEPYSGGLEIPKEKSKSFKPTPVISPIFGVLDKNYKKEDITDKADVSVITPKDKSMTIDDLRKKAYGTLEDDLESSLLHDDFYEEQTLSQNEKDMFDDFDLLEDVKEDSELSFLDIEEELIETRESRLSNLDSDSKIEEEVNKLATVKKQKNADDLFDLIDSMYEKGDDNV